MNFFEMMEAVRTGSVTRLPHWPVDVYLMMVDGALFLFNGQVHEPYTPDDADELSHEWVILPQNGGSW